MLATILNAAMTHCIFPAVWKEADVIGIHKPGKPRNETSSYRPISLLSTIGKIYERLLRKRLWDFVTANKILIDEQFGFRSKHSCVQQVHRLTEHILIGLNRRKQIPTGALFFDIAKAFDKVWHNGLI
ncbi:reverse transcriptase family protein, partial [Pseudomonas aeruginosa]